MTPVRRIVLGFMGTVTVLVLLFGYHTSTSSRRDGRSAVAAPIGGAADAAPSTAPSSAAAPSTAPSGASRTVTGASADTRWGPVQVQITVADGKVTEVSVVDYPDGNHRDQEINAEALPILVRETLSAQSADIDMVSGATVTSEGYLQSLQSALDRAGL